MTAIIISKTTTKRSRNISSDFIRCLLLFTNDWMSQQFAFRMYLLLLLHIRVHVQVWKRQNIALFFVIKWMKCEKNKKMPGRNGTIERKSTLDYSMSVWYLCLCLCAFVRWLNADRLKHIAFNLSFYSKQKHRRRRKKIQRYESNVLLRLIHSWRTHTDTSAKIIFNLAIVNWIHAKETKQCELLTKT